MYKKYLKYKQKYLNLKKYNNLINFQTGGDMVRTMSVIKNINCFRKPGNDTENYYTEEMISGNYKSATNSIFTDCSRNGIINLLLNHLCLIHGFIWNNTGLITNYFNCYSKYDGSDDLTTLVYNTFTSVPGEVRPTQNLLNLNTGACGFFIGIMFFKYILSIDSNLIFIVNYMSAYKGKKGAKARRVMFSDALTQQLQQEQSKLNETDFIMSTPIDMLYFPIPKDYYDTITRVNQSAYFKSRFKTIEDFHIFLAIVWWNCDDKDGIINYYTGLQLSFNYITIFLNDYAKVRSEDSNNFLLSLFNVHNIQIPKEYQNYNIETLLTQKKCTDWLESLTISYIYKNRTPIYSYDSTKYKYTETTTDPPKENIVETPNFSDCNETAIRNFLNLLITDNNTGRLDYNKYDNATLKLKTYYSIFSTYELQSSKELRHIFNLNLNSHDAWTSVVSDIPDINYKHNSMYEIVSGSTNGTSTNGTSVTRSNFFYVIALILQISHMYPEHTPSQSATTILYKFINYLLKNYSVYPERSTITKFEVDDNFLGKIIFLINDNLCELNMVKGHVGLSYTTNIPGNFDDSKVGYTYYYFHEYSISVSQYSITNTNVMKIKYDYNSIYNLYYNNMMNDISDEEKLSCENLYLIFKYIESQYKTLIEYICIFVTKIPKTIIYHKESLKHCWNKYEFNENDKIIKMVYPINRVVKPNELPDTVITLTFNCDFNKKLNVGVLPPSLKTLTFGSKFNQPIELDVLPQSLETLTFDNDFNQLIKQGVLPPSLKTLTFGSYFNQPIELDVLPRSLETLTFYSYFNQSIKLDVLPQSLKTLTFSYDLNPPLEPGVLPQSLETLTFDGDFNQKLIFGVLPQSLKTLTFGYNFNQSIEPGVLPSSLKTLNFASNYNQPIKPGVLPRYFKTLTVGSNIIKTLPVGSNIN